MYLSIWLNSKSMNPLLRLVFKRIHDTQGDETGHCILWFIQVGHSLIKSRLEIMSRIEINT